MYDIGVEGVEDIRLVGQGLKGNLPIPDGTGKAVAQGAVQHPQAVDGIFCHRQAQAVEVVAEEAKPFHVLFQRSGNGLDFAERGAVPQAQHPAQSRGKGGLAVFSGQHQQNFLVSPDHRTRQEEAADVVDDEHLEVAQEERRSSQGPAVQVLSLLMAEKRLDCLNAKLRKLCPKFPPGILQICKVPAAGGPDVLPRLRIRRSPQRILPGNLLIGCCH